MRLVAKILLVWLWLATLSVATERSEEAPLRLGVLRDGYPFSFATEDGRLSGFAYDLLVEIEAVMALRFERVTGTTSEINGAFERGEIDVLQSYAEFPEREAIADFTTPYLTMNGAIVVRAEERGVSELAELRGRRILVHAGSLGEAVLLREGLGDSIVRVRSVEEALRMVAAGEGDATLVGRLSGLALAHHLGLENLRALDVPVAGYEIRYCIAVQDGDSALLARLNEGLATLVHTGRYDELYQKWFGSVAPMGYSTEEIIGAVAFGLALALAVALWAALKQARLRRQIARQAEELRRSEERHRAIFEGSHDALLLLRPGARGWVAEQINPAGRRLFSPLGDEVAPTLERVCGMDAALAVRLEQAAARRETEEFEHARAGGGWLRVGVGPLGEAMLVRVADVSDAVEARERMRVQEEHLRQRQKLEAVGKLASGVAHDFNNLLTAIMGNTDLALRATPANERIRGHLETVMKASFRARDLVRQILTFSRQTEPRRERVELAPLIEETMNLLRTLARGTVEFELELPAGLPPLWADAAQLHQVMMNLGTNAVQAMRGRPGRLSVRAERVEIGEELRAQHPGLKPGVYVRVGVQDTGTGMAPEVLRRVFEPFYTTKATGEGTGLGLSVVHGIMQGHGGAVTVYSQPGRGTLFHLYFPVGEVEGLGAVEAVPRAPTGRSERVLLVDDDAAIVTMATTILESLGYRVVAHQDPRKAWAEFAGAPDDFALVVSDLTMPGHSGLDLLARVRERDPARPFVLTSGFFSEQERAAAQALRVTVLLPKPLSVDSLGLAVAQALGRA